jgi:hypothetical protein
MVENGGFVVTHHLSPVSWAPSYVQVTDMVRYLVERGCEGLLRGPWLPILDCNLFAPREDMNLRAQGVVM